MTNRKGIVLLNLRVGDELIEMIDKDQFIASTSSAFKSIRSTGRDKKNLEQCLRMIMNIIWEMI